jgi:DNA-binding NtrC family response regulator
MKHTVLIVDDEPTVLSSLRKVLELEGHQVLAATSGNAALEVLGREGPHLMLVDLRMPGLSGIETCTQARALKPGLPVIVMTAHSAPDTAIAAMKCGAYDYVIKPFDVVALIALVDRALQASKLEPPTVPIWSADDGERLVGSSPAMLGVYKRIGQVASSDLGVLIRGESGTGKELIARAIWTHSLRASKPLVSVNCAALPEALLESELFGHEKGAFTSAVSQRIGRFEQADGGTLFLDEVGDLSPGTQVKLLRVLQERTFERVGGSTSMKADVRIIAATHRNLEALLEAGRFREDLYYRLKVATITVPPLREHAEDIRDLADYFLRRGCAAQKRSGVAFSSEAAAALEAHSWPGNVRELEHCVSEAIVFCPGRWILPEHLRFGVPAPDGTGGAQAVNALRDRARQLLASHSGGAYHRFISEVEGSIIMEALKTTGGNLLQAAQILGISRPTLRVKMRSYGIRVGETTVRTGE